MLVGVTGIPGAGKSFMCIRLVVRALMAGKVVVTNFPLKPGWIRLVVRRQHFWWCLVPVVGRRRLEDFEAEATTRFHVIRDVKELVTIRFAGEGASRAVVVIEEAHTFLNAREWNKEDRGEVVAWASKVRHLGVDAYVVTQDLESIDRQVRAKMTYHVKLRNFKHWKVMGIPIWPFDRFLAIWHFPTAKAIVKREFFGLNWSKKLYDTHELGVWGEENRTDLLWLPRAPDVVPACPPDVAAAARSAAGGAPAGQPATTPAPSGIQERP